MKHDLSATVTLVRHLGRRKAIVVDGLPATMGQWQGGDRINQLNRIPSMCSIASIYPKGPTKGQPEYNGDRRGGMRRSREYESPCVGSIGR